MWWWSGILGTCLYFAVTALLMTLAALWLSGVLVTYMFPEPW